MALIGCHNVYADCTVAQTHVSHQTTLLAAASNAAPATCCMISRRSLARDLSSLRNCIGRAGKMMELELADQIHRLSAEHRRFVAQDVFFFLPFGKRWKICHKSAPSVQKLFSCIHTNGHFTSHCDNEELFVSISSNSNYDFRSLQQQQQTLTVVVAVVLVPIELKRMSSHS